MNESFNSLGSNVTGIVDKIIFFNEENSFCIAELLEKKNSERITILGKLPGISCGETLDLKGDWEKHLKHGNQFRVSNYTSKLPSSIYGIKKYLGSGLIKGIGKSYADRIVNHFGTKTIEIIDKQVFKLQEIQGIGKSRIKSIKKAWENQIAFRDVILFLQTYGVTPNQCIKLVKKYGNRTKRVIQDNPYIMAEEIDRIGFKTADQLAINLGFPNNSKERIEAGIMHILSKIEEEGHTISIINILVDRVKELLKLDSDLILARINGIIKEKKVIQIEAFDSKQNLLGYAIQTLKHNCYENNICKSIKRIYLGISKIPKIEIKNALTWIEKESKFEFENLQRKAIKHALTNKFTIITGGPGTGKTTILRALVKILNIKKCKVFLASPTGKAAQRLTESTDHNATTIHRLLKYDPSINDFFHNKNNCLDCDFLIIDEASMVDNSLSSSLLLAVAEKTHLVLVGDADQLPSVGPGNILRDLSNCPYSKVIELNKIFRQSSESNIITTAHNILNGVDKPLKSINSLKNLDSNEDFNFINVEDSDLAIKAIEYLIKDYIPKKFKYDRIKDIQVLSPMHKGTAGIKNLNQDLQKKINEAPNKIKKNPNVIFSNLSTNNQHQPSNYNYQMEYKDQIFKVGDKVIQTNNNYEKNVFNGDSGIIKEIDNDLLNVSINFNNELITYSKNELNEIQLSYALSIHKSQGSEYPVVIVPLLKQHYVMLQRNLLYTAITRAKKKLYLIGSLEAFSMAVRNNKTKERRTNLLKILEESFT